MNKIIKIVAVLVAIISLASCNQKAEFKTSSFVRLNSTSLSVKEDAGSVQIPVYAYPAGELSFPRGGVSTSVNFEVVDISAKKGVNYTVEPSNGVLTFSNSNQANITINVTNLAGEFTSDLKLKVVLTGASDGFTLGGMRENTVTIKDNDHPLSAILGTYTANVTDTWGDSYVIKTVVEPIDGSLTEVTLSDLCPWIITQGYTDKVKGVVSADMSTITVAVNGVYGNVGYFVAATKPQAYDLDELVFTFDKENMTLTNQSYYGLFNGGSWYDCIPPGSVFKKQ